MSCERPLRVANPRYACCIGADNYDSSKSYDGVTIQDFCEIYFGYRGRPPDEYIDVPCGKCFSCHKSRMNSWRIRLLSEVNRYPNSVFITLTFDNVHLSKFKDNPNKALHLYLDRLRKKYGKQVRHFFIPEYGENTHRLHYHGILFNVPHKKLDNKVFFNEWKYGFTFVGWCNEQTCNYIVKYITKEAPQGQKAPRLVVSKGLGESYVEQYGKYHHDTQKPYISVKGTYRVPLPRYYLVKIYSEYERVLLQEIQRLSPYERYVDGYKYTDEISYKMALKAYSKKQISIGLSSRPKLVIDSLRTFTFPRCEFVPLTPWDNPDSVNSLFNNLWTMNDKYLVPMSQNTYYWSETPF